MGTSDNKYLNSKGFSIWAILPVILLLFFLPGIMVSANEAIFNSFNTLGTSDRLKNQADNFAVATFAGIRSEYACTANLKSLGLVGKPLSAMNDVKFMPRFLQPNESGILRSEDITAPGSAGFILNGEVEMIGANFKFIEKRSLNTAVYQMALNFKSTDKFNGPFPFGRRVDMAMLVGVKDDQTIVSCVLTKAVDNAKTFLEDKICVTLNPNQKLYEMKNSSCI